jgi:hypothetical protein
MYNQQNTNATMSLNQVEKIHSNSTSGNIFKPSFNLNLIKIDTRNDKVIFTKEENGVSKEEEKNYYKKTLRSKLA